MPELGEPLERDPSTTAMNWQEAPHNRWSFWHVRELLPTQRVSRGPGPPRQLPRAPAAVDLLASEVVLHDRSVSTVREILDRTFTDAFVVAQDGVVVAEGYAPTGGPASTHALMSVTKSVVGCVAGILADRGALDLARDVVDYVPEFAGTGYAGATAQQLLDMRSGVQFREDYADPEADVRLLDSWIVGGGPQAADGQQGLYPFLRNLRAEAPHGSRFLYRSAETDALGWVCERAGDARMVDLMSELVWAPMGAEWDAEAICDTLGTAVHDGGLAATAIDLLRFGQMILDGGAVPDGSGGMSQVIPGPWLRKAWAVDAETRQAFLASPAEGAFPGGWYSNQFWFRPGEHGDVLLALGIHGQMLHVSRRTGTVAVKLSSWPEAQNPRFLQDTLRAFDTIGGALAHRAPTGSVHRLPGVVSGLRRGGASSQEGRGSAKRSQADDTAPGGP